jgi:hypothetical protein
MSNTTSWFNRIGGGYRYSQDERTLQYKFEKQITPLVNAFLDNPNAQTYDFGTYNLEAEPWRVAAAISFRKYNLKILEKEIDGMTEITLVKQKMSKTI